MSKRNIEFNIPLPALKLVANYFPKKNPYTINNHKMETIFIHIPKNAGRSVYKAALGEEGRHVPIKRFFAYDSTSCRRYFKFAIVRPPVDRFISAFRALKRSRNAGGKYGAWVKNNIDIFDNIESFGEWIGKDNNRKTVLTWLHFWPQYKWISLDSRSKYYLDKIIYFDNLNNIWPEFAREHGFETDLPIIGREDWGGEAQISSGLRELVNGMYARDLDLFF